MLNAFFSSYWRVFVSISSLDGNKIPGSVWMFWARTPRPGNKKSSLNSPLKHNLDRPFRPHRDCKPLWQRQAWISLGSWPSRAASRAYQTAHTLSTGKTKNKTKALVRSILEMACRNLLLCNICAREWCEAHSWINIPPLAYMTDCWVCVMLCCVEEKFAIHVESREERMKFSFWIFFHSRRC